MNFFQRFVKTSVQGFNVISLCAALSDFNSTSNTYSLIDSIAHGSALLSSLNENAHVLSFLTNVLHLGCVSYRGIQLDDFTLSLAINSYDVIIHLLNVVMEVTEANRESEYNGYFRRFN